MCEPMGLMLSLIHIFPELEDQLDFEFFVERLLDVHQAAGGGKLMEFTPHLTAVGQSHKRQDRSAELDPKRALSLLAGGSGRR